MRVLRTIDELDAFLADCDRASAVSDDAMREIFSGVRMEYRDTPSLDPMGEAYAAEQMALYKAISGRDYSLESEATPFDLDSATLRPFPYSTGSSRTVGDHLGLIGFMLRHLDLPQGAKVLEFGPGWGNLTLAMAQVGLSVTAVDVESRFCELIRRRADRDAVSIDVVNADFFWADTTTERFDRVIFFECFHHCSDHMRLLRVLHRLLKPGGRVLLSAEPILPDFPVPWGVRLDGQSLWSIRKFGWMELGFNDAYLQRALAATGWRSQVTRSVELPGMAVWDLVPANRPMRLASHDPRLLTQLGTKREGGIEIRAAAAGYGLYGPYLVLPAGLYRMHVMLEAAPRLGKALLDACYAVGRKQVGRYEINFDANPNASTEIEILLETDVSDLEIRLFCQAGFAATVIGLDIVPLDVR